MALQNMLLWNCARWRAPGVVALTLLACACTGSGEGLDENGRPLDESPAPPPGGGVDFAALQNTIFTPLCTACHAGGGAPLGLRLEAGVSYAMLVNIASVEVPALRRVAPGDPDASYLVHKIEGRAAVGARMPLGGPPLSQASVNDVRQWISAGALPPTANAATGAPPAVVASAPLDGELLTGPVTRLLVVFSTSLDASLVNASTVELFHTGQSESLAPGGARPMALRSVRVPLGDPRSVWIETRVPLGDGEYELRLRGSGAAVIADLSGVALDGDGDGAAGGDYRTTFTVTETSQ